MRKKIITLTTDFGEDSFYEAILKGKLMKALPNAIITSITNKITKFDIRETAFVLRINSSRKGPYTSLVYKPKFQILYH